MISSSQAESRSTVDETPSAQTTQQLEKLVSNRVSPQTLSVSRYGSGDNHSQSSDGDDDDDSSNTDPFEKNNELRKSHVTTFISRLKSFPPALASSRGGGRNRATIVRKIHWYYCINITMYQ